MIHIDLCFLSAYLMLNYSQADSVFVPFFLEQQQQPYNANRQRLEVQLDLPLKTVGKAAYHIGFVLRY